MTPIDAGGCGPMALARALYAAYNAHRPELAGELYAPAATHVEVASGRCATGPVDIARGLETFLRAFPDAQWEPEQPIIGSDAVAVPYRLTGTLRTQLGPVVPRGQRLDLRGIHVIRTGGQAITSTADYWDAATFQAQMKEIPEGAGEDAAAG